MQPIHDRRTPRTAAGFSLVEVMMALTVASVAVMGLLGAMTAGAKLQQRTQNFGQASRAAMQVRETLRNGDLDLRVADYQANPNFEVGQIAVQVSFPEQVLVDILGAPVPVGWRYRDLDADGEVDPDPAATAQTSLVPCQVVTSWSGSSLTTSFLVTER